MIAVQPSNFMRSALTSLFLFHVLSHPLNAQHERSLLSLQQEEGGEV